MSDDDVIKSQPFEAPFVRVRGRLSRRGAVKWSPCLRTFHPPAWIEGVGKKGGIVNPLYADVSLSRDSGRSSIASSTSVAVTDERRYVLTFEDSQGRVLARTPVRIRFFATDREWALFTQRLPYHRETHRVVLRRGERELGALVVTHHVPEFVLIHPVKSSEVDVEGVLHLRWEIDPSAKQTAKKFPHTYYVRYSADSDHWHRPGVNITTGSFDLDLREMPGGKHCVAQIIATNGYETSYVETPPFDVPRKPPEILLATPNGPLLFAQGFSREDGALVGESIVWLADGEKSVGTGASFDVRRLGGRHELSVRVTDLKGAVTLQHLGLFDGETGRRVGPLSGL